MMVLILEEKVFVSAVSGESNRCCAQSRESALESVPSGEGALVSPSLTESMLVNSIASGGRFTRTRAPRDRIVVGRLIL